jgi:magnesium transporter
MEGLSEEEIIGAFRLLPKILAVQVFDRLDTQSRYSLLNSFTGASAKTILESMAPDDRAELLEEVPAIVARRLLRHLSPEEREITLKLLGYEDGTAGRAMNPDFVDLHDNMTVTEALERIRQQAVTRETIYELYVIDNERRLMGTISLKDLVLAKPEEKIRDIMRADPIEATTGTNQEDVVKILRENIPLVHTVVE